MSSRALRIHHEDQSEIEVLNRAIEREKNARIRAEDILESKAAELFNINEKLLDQNKTLKQKSAEFKFLYSVFSLVEEDLRLLEAITKFIKLVCDLTHWPVAHIYLPTHTEPEKLVSSKVWHISDLKKFGEFKEVSEKYQFVMGEGLPGSVWESKKCLWIKDLSTESNFPRKKLLTHLVIKSGFAVPVVLNDKVVAVMEFFTDVQSVADDSLVAIIQVAISQLEGLILRQKTQDQLKENYLKLVETQVQLVHSEKMASLGTIAAGVAHEINNPISFVLANTETMASYVKSTKEILNQYTELHELIEQKKYTEADIKIKKISEIKNALDIDYVFSDCAQLLQESISGIHRVKDIVQGLKTFSRVDDTDTQLTDLNDCIEAAVKVLWNEIKHKCVLNKDLNVLPLFYCHSGQMVQVFTNLLLNAVQAIDHSGKIEIKSSSNASSITISITDSGHGITPENLKQIFTPFFSTKPVGSGTGLGLSISYGIIKGCGGEILVSSTVGRGTTFTIKLPVKETV